MAETFGTIPFTVLQAGMGRVQTANVAFAHIPGGNVTYVDYGGQQPLSLPYNLLLSEANYRTLEGTVGGTAALVTTVDGSINTAVLLSLSRASRIPVSGTVFVTAAFVVVTP
jgi:hypothetical protein